MDLGLRGKSNKVLLYLGNKWFLRYVSLRPEWADIRVTERCNSRCSTCYAWKSKPKDELNTEEWKDAIHQLKGVGVKNIVFIGGEPLLRADIGALVKEASLLSFENIIVVTNGLLLKDKADELLRNGVTQITVSVDGVGPTNDEIRGVPGDYDRAIEGIKTAQRLKKDMDLRVSVTLALSLIHI